MLWVFVLDKKWKHPKNA